MDMYMIHARVAVKINNNVDMWVYMHKFRSCIFLFRNVTIMMKFHENAGSMFFPHVLAYMYSWIHALGRLY